MMRYPPFKRFIAVDTYANIKALTPPDGSFAWVTDVGINGGSEWRYTVANGWNPTSQIVLERIADKFIAWGGGPGGTATYSQSGKTVTVTSATGHGLTAARHNGLNIQINVATGSLPSQICINFTYISATQFSCTAAASATTSGNIATNTGGQLAGTFTLKGGLLAGRKLQTQYMLDTIASSNSRGAYFLFGASADYVDNNVGANQASMFGMATIAGVSPSLQYSWARSAVTVGGVSTSLLFQWAENTSSDVVISNGVYASNAADYACLMWHEHVLLP